MELIDSVTNEPGPVSDLVSADFGHSGHKQSKTVTALNSKSVGREIRSQGQVGEKVSLTGQLSNETSRSTTNCVEN